MFVGVEGCGCGEVGTVPEHQMKTQQKGTEEAGKPGPEETEVRGGGGGRWVTSLQRKVELPHRAGCDF